MAAEWETWRDEISDLRETAGQLATRLRIAQKFHRWLLAIVAALVVVTLVLVGLVVRVTGESHRTTERVTASNQVIVKQVQGSCRFYADMAALDKDLTARSTTLTFTLIADARNAYEALGCPSSRGVLPDPDPRIVPYLEGER